MSEFEATYRQHVAYVWRALQRLGVLERDREDLAHEVFVVALRHWQRFDRSRRVEPWLFGISFRIVVDFNRKRRIRPEDVAEAPEVADPRRAPDEALADAQRLELAARALAQLDLDRRAVFVMHDVDGCGMPEIAESLGLPLNTAYSRLRLARRDFNAAAEALQRRPRHV